MGGRLAAAAAPRPRFDAWTDLGVKLELVPGDDVDGPGFGSSDLGVASMPAEDVDGVGMGSDLTATATGCCSNKKVFTKCWTV
jgi:hypothetical protein